MDTSEEDNHQLVAVCARLVECYYYKFIHKSPCMNSSQTGNMWLNELLQGNKKRCYRMFRMGKDVFVRLCIDMENNYGLESSRRMSSIEMLGMFVHILGHGVGNRLAQERFQHSGETVSRYFGKLLDIVCLMAIDVIKPSDPMFNDTPNEILTDSRYMPHFKNCIGAIDGVHIPASIPVEDQVPYIGRKGIPTQNVMAACDFGMQFIFAYAGWEGTAHDTRVFYAALNNPTLNFPKPPKGKYYLVDCGYPQMQGYLGPYKGDRYHLPDFRWGSQPSGYREVFNHAHSSLRSVIERTFGVWKRKSKILREMPNYTYEKQVKIVIATMTLHNYIRRYSRYDQDFDDTEIGSDIDDDDEEVETENHSSIHSGTQEMERLRDRIATSLMQIR